MTDTDASRAPFAFLPPWARAPVRWAGWLALVLGAAVLSLLLVVALALAVAYPNLPEIASLADYRPKLPLRVFSADGVQIGEFGEERRNFMPIAQMPQVMKDAVLAAEDARFYQHGGIDWRGMVRAALANLRDARSQGGSSITMQVARNFYLSTEKTFTRKIYEVLLALKIERALSKDQILELYMNQIFLGQRANGFAAAAEIYFGKRLQDVTVAEAAMLAGLPKAPSAYNPVSNPRRATARQRYIIDRMFETGFITEAQHEQALAQVLRYRTQSDAALHAERMGPRVALTREAAEALPCGAMVGDPATRAAWLRVADGWRRWTPTGYENGAPCDAALVRLTPATALRALAGGYRV